MKNNPPTTTVFLFSICINFNLTEFIPGSSKDKIKIPKIETIILVHNAQEGSSIKGIMLYANTIYSTNRMNPDATATNRPFRLLVILTIPIQTSAVIVGMISTDVTRPTNKSKELILPSFLEKHVKLDNPKNNQATEDNQAKYYGHVLIKLTV